MSDEELAERDAARRQRDWETICRVVDRLQTEMPHLSYFDEDAFSPGHPDLSMSVIRDRVMELADAALGKGRTFAR